MAYCLHDCVTFNYFLFLFGCVVTYSFDIFLETEEKLYKSKTILSISRKLGK